MNLSALLNLIWAAIAATALGCLAYAEFRSRNRRRSCLRRAVSVLIAAFLLFPCVSASDDWLWVRALPLRPESGRGAGTSPINKSDEKASINLARLLEAVGNFQVAGIYSLPFTACFFFLFRLPNRKLRTLRLSSRAGRDPPVFSLSR